MPLITPYDREVLRDRPTGYWPMDERGAETAGRNLSTSGTPTLTVNASTLATKPLFGPARIMSMASTASTNKATIADDVMFSATSISLEFWMKWPGTSDDLVIEKGNHTPTYHFEWQFYIATNTMKWELLQAGGTSYSSATSGVLATDHLYHIVGTFDSASSRTALYLDGVLAASSTSTAGSRTNGTALVGLGGYSSGSTSSSFGGDLGRFAVYDYALAPHRVAAHHRAGRRAFAGRLPRAA